MRCAPRSQPKVFEEKTLVKWLSNLTRAGFPASPALLVEMAEEVRRSRFKLSEGPPPQLQPLGKNWSLKFRTRYPDIKGAWTRQIERARYEGVNSETLSRWFDAVRALMDEHRYAPSQIYNMDESGFAVGTSQASRALVNVRDKSSWKKIQGRQEWITAIEVVDAAGSVGPPLLIFKSKHLSTAWARTARLLTGASPLAKVVGQATVMATSGLQRCLSLGAGGACLTLPLGAC